MWPMRQTLLAPAAHAPPNGRGPGGRPSLSVVIPCHNEEEGLRETVGRVMACCGGRPLEVILVDDGSRDGTWERICALAAERPEILGVRLSRNFGQQAALSAGLEAARGERVLILDADLQDPPEMLGRMEALMDAGADVVYGQRASRDGEGWFKRATAAAFYRVFNALSDHPIPENVGDFRLMNRRAADALLAMPERNRFIRGMSSWVGFRQAPLRFVRPPRARGASSYPLRRMLFLAADALVSFSTKPLRVAFWFGLLMAAAALGWMGFIGWQVIRGDTVRGWASLMWLVLASSSVQFLLIGVLGEYIGRVLQEVKGRPVYLASETAGRGLGAMATGQRGSDEQY